jgi:HEPN domain-containing protein
VPPSKAVTGSPEDWLARAKVDLALAQVELPSGGFYEDLCFNAQQAAKKAIKGVFVLHSWAFPYIHDLAELIGGLERRQLAVPMEVKDAA